MAAPQSLQEQLAKVERAATRTGHSALVQASAMGREAVLAHLLRQPNGSAGAAGNDASCRDRTAAFVAAARQGHAQCLRVLLEAAASCAAVAELVQATDDTGWTALMSAASFGHTGCVELLLRAYDPDAQVKACDEDGWNALALAAFRGHSVCMALLLQHSPEAQVAACPPDGRSALVWAAEGGHLPCLQLLLLHSPQLQRSDTALAMLADGWASQQLEEGWSTADSQRYQRCAELLLSHGAMLTARSAAEAFALVRPVIQDLAARALVPDMANEAVAQAVQEARGRKRGNGCGGGDASRSST